MLGELGLPQYTMTKECHTGGALEMCAELLQADSGLAPCCCCHQDHLLPAEYVQTMRDNLLDRCPVAPYKEVAAVIEQDLGAAPSALFASFDPTPVASASLAQVGAGGVPTHS